MNGTDKMHSLQSITCHFFIHIKNLGEETLEIIWESNNNEVKKKRKLGKETQFLIQWHY